MELLTRQEIRDLPEYSIIRQHSFGKFGYKQVLDIYVLNIHGVRKYCYKRYDGKWEETFLRRNARYELIKRGNENEQNKSNNQKT